MGANTKVVAFAIILALTLCFLFFSKYRGQAGSSSISSNEGPTHIRTTEKFSPISPHTASSGDGDL